MNCNRCMGLCITDSVEENGRALLVERCINCGNIAFPKTHDQKSIVQKPRKKRRGNRRRSRFATPKKPQKLRPLCA